MIKKIESNEDGEPVYQGQKLKYYSREIQFLKNHGVNIIKSIFSCYAERYCNIQKLVLTILLVMVTQQFLVPAVFWTQLFGSSWMIPTMIKKLTFTAINSILERFKFMPVFESVTCESLQSGYADIIHYVYRYSTVIKINPMNLCSKICLGSKENESWHDIILLVELCLCTLFSNTTLERFFSHLKIAKIKIESRLSNESSNSVMRIHSYERVIDYQIQRKLLEWLNWLLVLLEVLAPQPREKKEIWG